MSTSRKAAFHALPLDCLRVVFGAYLTALERAVLVALGPIHTRVPVVTLVVADTPPPSLRALLHGRRVLRGWRGYVAAVRRARGAHCSWTRARVRRDDTAILTT